MLRPPAVPPAVTPPPDTAQWAERACALVTRDRLAELVALLVDVPSPTGGERPLAEAVVAEASSRAPTAWLQPLDADQANAVVQVPGDGSGEHLLLYAPTDTVTTGNARFDVPWAAAELTEDMLPRAVFDGDLVTGLGAGNPKGHAACVLAAVEAVAAVGAPLAGTVTAALGAGGMPTGPLPGSARANTGQGAGCSFLLEQGVHPDRAVIAKPGWTVSWEEVGLAWFEVTVAGEHSYVGSRHRLPHRNPIVDAAQVVTEVEAWFAQYTRRHSDELVAPQGVVGYVEGGWARMPAFTPAVCRLRIDLRLSPRTAPAAAEREFAALLAGIRKETGIDVSHRMILSIPGTRTDPDAWVIGATVAAWQAEYGRAVPLVTGTSGATDANILRGRGVPTARIGMPKPFGPDGRELGFTAGMNTADLREMTRLTRTLVRVAMHSALRGADTR